MTRRTIDNQLTLTGTLSRLAQRTVTAAAAAQVSDVSVQDGAIVNAGQSIIGLDGREMVAEPGSLPFFRSLTVGDQGPDVHQLEQILADTGYLKAPIGDVFTQQTATALAGWQAAHGYGGIAPDRPLTLTVSLQQSAAYSLGPQSTAGLVIGGASTTARLTPGAVDAVLTSAATIPTLSIYALDTVTPKGSPAVFVVYSSQPSSQPIDFSVTEEGTAPPDEVLPASGPFAIPPGATSVQVQVPTRANGLVEPDAALSLRLATGSGYSVGSPSVATTTIRSADIPQLSLHGGGTVPAGGTAAFTITADQPPVHDTTVVFQVGGTAQPGQDFVPVPSSILLHAGQRTATVSLHTLNRNVVFEPTDMIAGAWPIRVGQVFVKAGDLVAPGGQLFNLTDANFTVQLSASPSDRTQLKVGQAVTVQLQGGSAQADGVISELDDNLTYDATTKAQSYQGKISVGDLGAADGATVTIDVTVQAAENVLSVPIAAVKQDGLGQDVVRVIDLAHGAAIHEVPVRTGLADSSYMQIESGLSEGQVVIVETDKTAG
ncbi:MAG TPA: HlyD family efflux transporter periplasmic adaptor subunit [Mycobacterium sp.]|nr:HlyD family efflux transporter periplasmic adaptor subunit [Mycobacterium sp.]